MDSTRFARPVTVTQHAARRMAERGITDALLLDLIDTGDVRNKDAVRLWIAKHYADRTDNMLCAAVALEATVVVKTVMHHFEWSGS
jgi:hypothetical protein